ncbi:MAG: O-antigen ligase family protein [Cetobacterium sp.]|uniref:O-antigen ligase family protein n=1 Tax=Cetobacterium sp. TaxID=2071632 RepID=UPI002FC911C7
MLEKIYKKLDDLGILVICISLLALLTHNYFRALTLLLIIVGMIYIRKNGYKKVGLELPISIYVLTLVISLVMPLNLKASSKEIYRHLYGFVAPFMLGQIVISDEKKQKYLDFIMRGIILYFFIRTNLMILKYLPSQFGNRYIPLPIMPVEFSYIAGVVAVYVWGRFLKEKNRYQKVLNLSFVLMIVYVILQTRTRGAWIGLFGAYIFMFILKSRDVLKNILKSISIILGLVGFGYYFKNAQWFNPYYNRLQSISNTTTDYSNTARLIAWKIGFERFSQRKLTGWGYKVKNSYNVGPLGGNQVLDHPHNDYVAYLVGGGTIGLIGYLYLMLSIIWKGLKNLDNTLWLVMLGICSYTMIYGLVETLFQVTNSLFLFLAFLGIVLEKNE